MKLYAIVRKDLHMPTGKLAAQAGHAFLNSYLECVQLNPRRARLYQKGGLGTKVTLEGSVTDIRALVKLAKANGWPHSLIIDSGHVMPPHFDGNPIMTALGIGPLTREEAKALKHLSLVK
jgi:PTH2 family peptidyl-tRNA hydrolase